MGGSNSAISLALVIENTRACRLSTGRHRWLPPCGGWRLDFERKDFIRFNTRRSFPAWLSTAPGRRARVVYRLRTAVRHSLHSHPAVSSPTVSLCLDLCRLTSVLSDINDTEFYTTSTVHPSSLCIRSRSTRCPHSSEFEFSYLCH